MEYSGAMRLRSIAPAVVAALFVSMLHLGWWAVGFSSAEGSGLTDPDSYMRLVRIERLLAMGGWFDSALPRANAPDGGDLHWTRSLDLLLLVVALPMAPVLGMKAALFAAAVLISPLLHVAAVLALAWAVTPLLGRRVAALAGAFTAIQPGIISYAHVGTADHHTLYLLVTILAFGALLHALLSPEGRAGAGTAGVFLAAGLWVGPETLVFIALALVACGLPWLCGEARGAVTAVRAMLAAFLAGLAIVALEWEPGALTGVA